MKQGKQGTISLGNHGSMIIEVTLIMPVILLLMILFITLLLSVFQQAKVHSTLMMEHTEDKDHGGSRENDGYSVEVQGDRRIYSKPVEVVLVQGYGITSVEQQVMRVSDIENKLRRWQLVGDMVSE